MEDDNEDFFHIDVWRSQVKKYEDFELPVGESLQNLKAKFEELFENSISSGSKFLAKCKVPNLQDQNLKLIQEIVKL